MSKIQQPKTEKEIASIVSQSYASSTSLEIIGGGTRPIGNKVEAQSKLSTSSLDKISLYEPGALTIVADAGASVEAIKKTLEAENQHLPFEPADFSKLLGTKGKPTIGSVVATANSGPRRIQVGAARDALIGVRFINGEGQIIKNGGRVMKNVTGYDLVKLMCGSYGTLGILSEVSFKILPQPETAATLIVHGLTDSSAISVLSKALGSPFDVSGAAHAPNGLEGYGDVPITMIRLEGFEQSIAYRSEKLKELVASTLSADCEIMIEKKAAKIASSWQAVRDVLPFANKQGAVWKISAKPTDGPLIADELRKHSDLEVLYDWGGGLVWALIKNQTKEDAISLRKIVDRVGGHATLVRADEKFKDCIEAFHPEHPSLANYASKLRLQFDPKSILNPNRMARDNSNSSLERN